MSQKSILLIITGSIAAYKSLELIRRLRENGVSVRAIITKSGEKFVTPFSVSALTENPVYSDLWSLKDETEMGHIRLTREADLVVVAPASADIIAKMANGLADDLASATLLASDKPIIVAPAMNSMMWSNSATQRNLQRIREDGVKIIEPSSGMLACGEIGQGRMAEVEVIIKEIFSCFKLSNQKVLGLDSLTAVVTAGATLEPLDPVRFLSNRSSGRQGYAIAAELAEAGAKVVLVSGNSSLPVPHNVEVLKVKTALEMQEAVERTLPCDIGIFTAAVCDYRPQEVSFQKIKKKAGETAPVLQLVENPDILRSVSYHKNRPELLIGFAAETENLKENAKDKLIRKNCDWILANDVSENKVFDEENTEILFMGKDGCENWGKTSKRQAAAKLVEKITSYFVEKRKNQK